MQKNWSQLTISVPDLGNVRELFMALGLTVIDGIHDMIERGEQPDGSPQMPNTKGIAMKKALHWGRYTPPLVGMSEESPRSPYLSTRKAWNRFWYQPDTLRIELNDKRKEIGQRLQEDGYWFMGITKEAEEAIHKRTEQYFRAKMKQIRADRGKST